MSISIEQFACLNDQQLYQLAEFQTAMTSEERKNSGKAMLYTLPIVDSFVTAATQEGSLGVKSGAFAKRMGSWGALFALLPIYNKGLNEIYKRSPKLQEIKKEHSFATFIAELASLWFILGGVNKGLKKLTGKFAQKYPEKMLKWDNFKESLKNKIDNSLFEKKVYQPICKGFQKLQKKAPTLVDGAKHLAPFIVPVMIFGAISKSISAANEIKNKTIDNFEQLKEYQNGIRERLYTQRYF